jgi:hypothetical protein
MVNKFVNFEREMNQKDTDAKSDEAGNQEVLVQESGAASADANEQQKNEADFSNKIFDPDQYMPFDTAIRNICMYSQKQASFEKRRDEASRRAYGDRATTAKLLVSLAESCPEIAGQGYSDGFLLSSRSKEHSKNLNVFERFN